MTSLSLFFQLSRRCHRRTKIWFKSLSAESRHKKCCLCFHGISLPPYHSVNTQKTPRNSDRTGWSPAAPMKHQTSHQCVNDFLPFRRKKSGGAPDVWHFILTPAYLSCRVDIFSSLCSSPFTVFLLHWTDLFCSLCCCPCLLPLNPPSLPPTPQIFPLTLDPLPTQSDVKRDRLLCPAQHSLKLSTSRAVKAAPVVGY